MANERQTPAPAAEGHTRYLVFKRHGDGEIPIPGGKVPATSQGVEGKETPTQAVEQFVLLPGEFTGDPVRSAAAKWGEGEYLPVPVRSGKRRTVTFDTTPRIKVS